MALKRIVGTAVRHPLASTALVVGVAKGTLGVVRRVLGGDHLSSSASEASPQAEPVVETESVREPEVVPADAVDRDLPEPVVIEAIDEEPEPAPDYSGHVELEEELVWTSESSGPPASE